MLHNIPHKYRGPGVLHKILLIAIRDNWGRIESYYNDVYSWLGQNDWDRDIDKALLTRFRKDIKQDGPDFIDTPDGIGGRLKDWLIEAFPQAFGLKKDDIDYLHRHAKAIENGASLHRPYEDNGIYEDDDEDSLLNDEIVRKW